MHLQDILVHFCPCRQSDQIRLNVRMLQPNHWYGTPALSMGMAQKGDQKSRDSCLPTSTLMVRVLTEILPCHLCTQARPNT